MAKALFPGTSLFFQTNRIPLIDYLSMVTPTRSAFLFRAPPLSTVSNIYLLPFTNLVWLTTGFIVVLAVIFIFTILMVQTKFVDFEGPENSSRFSDCILIGISAISQMGIILQPRRMSLRIASVRWFQNTYLLVLPHIYFSSRYFFLSLYFFCTHLILRILWPCCSRQQGQLHH